MALHIAISQEWRKREREIIGIGRRNITRMRAQNPHASPLLEEWELPC
ncbi:MAG: hypothetical protein OXF75_06930 [Acidimicrobiaceae bacterium]|nr:hypothetical protein [Acidimicrobiaceae bacterium]